MTKVLRILHLEDSPADAELIGHVLRKAGLEVTLLRVENRALFVTQLEEFQPDIIIADYRLPKFDGMQALAIATEKAPLTPFIFVTGTLGEDVIVETLKNGATDYVLKDRMNRLPNAVLQAVEKKEALAKRAQAERALSSSEEKFRVIFESSADAILLQDENEIIDCNPAALKMFGCARRDDLIGLHPALIFAHAQAGGEDSFSLANQYITKAMKEAVQHFEWISCRLDGVEFFSDVLLTSIEIDNKKLLHVTVRDITEHKIQHAKIQRLTNLFSALSQCNQAIVRCSSESELFPKICSYAVEYGGMKMAWVWLLNEATRQIMPVAAYGEGTDYLENIQISVDSDIQFSHGPTGTAFREKRPVWCQDFMLDPKTAPWKDVAAQYQWASSASLPLYREGVLVGVLTFYADTINAFDEETCKLLNEMADDVSFALDNFAREASRKMNESILKDSEERFRSLIEQSIAGVYIIQDGKFVYVNPRFAEILGYSNSDGLLGRDPLEIVVAKDRRLVEQNLHELKDGEVMAVSYIFTALHKNGMMVDVGMNSSKATYQGRPAVIGLMQDISDKKVAEEQIKRYATQLQITFMQTVGLVTTLSEIRDPYTAGHERRVAEIAVAIGKELGLDALQ